MGPMGVRSQHPLDDLKAIAEHVEYERAGVILPLAVPIQPRLPGDEHDALHRHVFDQVRLESTLIHIRNLIDFLTGKPDDKYPLGVVANDFFDDGWPSPAPNVVIGKDTNEQSGIYRALNGRLAHLTLMRLDSETKASSFNWQEVVLACPKLLRSYDSFIEKLRVPHPDRAQWFLDARWVG